MHDREEAGVGLSDGERSTTWRLRRVALMGLDSAAWATALGAAVTLRLEFDLTVADLIGAAWLALVAIVAQLGFGAVLQAYRGRYLVGSADDAVNLIAVVALVGPLILTTNLVVEPQLVPRSVPIVGSCFALALIVGARLTVRRRRERASRPDRDSAQRVIVLGARTAGQQVVQSMLSDPQSGYLPVALLDDDPGLRRRRVCGVPVRGTRRDIAAVAEATGASMLVVAQRNLRRAAMQEVAATATGAGLGVKVVPPLAELLRPWAGLGDLRDLDITDLLGRRPVEIDLETSAAYLTGRRVLVTGAGGSIGSELCRQIHRFAPAELLMLDRDESALHATQLSIYGRALLDSSDVILADIRDSAALAEIFLDRRPEVVFHAAALKHLPLLQQFPEEAWKSNVAGTQNVLTAATLAGVDRFVNISTDKAADPVSILGRSKRVGERLVAHEAARSDGVYVSVRFGNVLGSRGSVLMSFAEQVAAGGPVTVTHPDVTRFFMTIPEAVQLVINAGAVGRPGEALVLDMGQPVRIVDVARQMMSLAGRSAEIVFTGLRDGEKLHEDLFGEDEVDLRPIHPLISHVDVPPLDPAFAADRAAELGVVAAMTLLTDAGAVDTTGPVIPAGRRGEPVEQMWRQLA